MSGGTVGQRIAAGNLAVFGLPAFGAPAGAGNTPIQGRLQRGAVDADLSAADDRG